MNQQKVKVVCHMASTVNGKILSAHWGNFIHNVSALYEQIHQQYAGEAWMCGRVTMEKDFSKGEKPVLEEDVPMGTIVSSGINKRYLIR